MIVVAIIGVLAAIALPSYQNYTYKAKFAEVIQALAPYKLAVETCAHAFANLNECSNTIKGEGQNGIPPAIDNPANSKSYLKTLKVTATAADVILITAISQHIGKENLDYILQGMLGENGQLRWQKDPQSTCIAAGWC